MTQPDKAQEVLCLILGHNFSAAVTDVTVEYLFFRRCMRCEAREYFRFNPVDTGPLFVRVDLPK